MLQRALPGLGLTILVFAAAMAALIDIPWLPLIIVVVALGAYAFVGLRYRVAALAPEQRQDFMRPHLRWLASLAVLDLIVGGVGLLLRARPSFTVLALLALIGVGLLALAVRRAVTQHD